MLNNTIKKTVNKMIAHHIVGVPALALCSLANSVAFPIVASLRICFQSFSSCNILIKKGVKIKPSKNVAIQKENMSTRRDSIDYNYIFIFI